MALDLDKELHEAIATAALLYGQRDETFELLPVGHHQRKYAQSIIDHEARTISVKLADAALFTEADKDNEAKYELWHEAVHCLAPVGRMDTLWFEEGVALRFSLKHAPIPRVQRKRFRRAIGPPWRLVLDAFDELNPTDSQIKAIRERAYRNLFDTVTKELIIETCGVTPKLADRLCQRLSSNTR
jgi:hypothetical protein